MMEIGGQKNDGVLQELDEVVLHHLPDALHVVQDARHHLARLGGGEIPERLALHVPEELHAQVVHHVLGDVRGEVLLRDAEQPAAAAAPPPSPRREAGATSVCRSGMAWSTMRLMKSGGSASSIAAQVMERRTRTA